MSLQNMEFSPSMFPSDLAVPGGIPRLPGNGTKPWQRLGKTRPKEFRFSQCMLGYLSCDHHPRSADEPLPVVWNFKKTRASTQAFNKQLFSFPSLSKLNFTMSASEPTYVAFFGVMGATSAMVFSGKSKKVLLKKWPNSWNAQPSFLKRLCWYLFSLLYAIPNRN